MRSVGAGESLWGLGVTVFQAAVKSVLIDPLPQARVERLVLSRSEFRNMPDQSQGDWVVWNDAQEVIRGTRTLESVGVYRYAVYELAGDSATTPEALYGLKVTANLFATLGVSPILGRNIFPRARPKVSQDIFSGFRKYTEIRALILSIFAIPHSDPPWLATAKDDVREKTKAFNQQFGALAEQQVRAFEEGLPDAHVVRIPNAHHYVFMTNEAHVLPEMRAFIAQIK